MRLHPFEHVDPVEARTRAHAILSQRRFRPEQVPRPLAGVLTWLGDRLEPLGRLLQPLWDLLATPVGALVGLVALGLLAAFLASRVSARRAKRAAADATAFRHGAPDDPRRLEELADAAARAGELDRALRLRFRAGLLRLDRAGAIHLRPSLTSGQVARVLQLPTFDRLAGRFEGVAYGGRHVSAPELETNREEWRRVLADVS